MRIFISLFALIILSACQPAQKTSDPLAGLDHREGFIDLYVDKSENKVFAKFPKADEDGVSLRLIHTARLTAGHARVLHGLSSPAQRLLRVQMAWSLT